ncbi:hypothetical protein AMELA_G00021330 [Ameiurus melas]|uniref:DDE Tnp4 domain-containing protein n=1 Tax=Ameiurus melas TaxID=219545 RepID=A0A7J6BBQ9_AMEME|nr:hypothetical protein AMELA_G00021330 [Ameiurus melas]
MHHDLIHPYIRNINPQAVLLHPSRCFALLYVSLQMLVFCITSGMQNILCRTYAGFPNVVGCIDGTHIPIIAPSENEVDYVNRRSIHSINVQIICDAAHIITNVEAKWPGSVHDARMYRESTLSNRLEREPEPGPQQRYNVAHCRTRAQLTL